MTKDKLVDIHSHVDVKVQDSQRLYFVFHVGREIYQLRSTMIFSIVS